MAGPLSYRHGRIVWAYLRSNVTHQRAAHPAIVLDRDEDLTQPEDFDPRKLAVDNFVCVIGVSTKHKKYRSTYIQLPFAPDGHGTTKLKEDCGAIIGWYARLTIPDDVIGLGGIVPASIMHQIDDAVRHDLGKRLGTQFDTIREMLDELLDDDD